MGIIKNHIAFDELLMHNINPNKVHQESRNCDTRDPENVEKTRDQSLLSDMSDSDSYSHNDELLCTTEKQSDGNRPVSETSQDWSIMADSLSLKHCIVA